LHSDVSGRYEGVGVGKNIASGAKLNREAPKKLMDYLRFV
jgi:hypothetical protein